MGLGMQSIALKKSFQSLTDASSLIRVNLPTTVILIRLIVRKDAEEIL